MKTILWDFNRIVNHTLLPLGKCKVLLTVLLGFCLVSFRSESPFLVNGVQFSWSENKANRGRPNNSEL